MEVISGSAAIIIYRAYTTKNYQPQITVYAHRDGPTRVKHLITHESNQRISGNSNLIY